MKANYQSFLKKFRNQNILVIGDFILDVYLEGSCTRLAPEAAVPVIDVSVKKHYLGGAANTALNLKALGCAVQFCSVTGEDEMAAKANKIMVEEGLSTEGIIRDALRSTMVKTRVCAPSHTIVRFDEGTDASISSSTEEQLIAIIYKMYSHCDGVIIADYNKGILTPGVLSALKKLRSQSDKFLAVDSKRLDFFAPLKPSLIKPNYQESISLLSLPYSYTDRAEQMKPFGQHFFNKTNAALIALTLDSEGSLYFEKGEYKFNSVAPKVNNANVSGAGDTFISAFSLALLSGAPLPAAAGIATGAATIAIQKSGTSVCFEWELSAYCIQDNKNINSVNLKDLVRKYKSEGRRIVFTNGCFDILHSGHVSYLTTAREKGDVLIVGINNDQSIKRLKGLSRPINSLENRMKVLSGLSCVDHVISFGSQKNDTPVDLIKLIKPDVFVKGADYLHKKLPEEKLLRRLGAEIFFLPFVPDQSTTLIINKAEENNYLKIAVANL